MKRVYGALFLFVVLLGAVAMVLFLHRRPPAPAPSPSPAPSRPSPTFTPTRPPPTPTPSPTPLPPTATFTPTPPEAQALAHSSLTDALWLQAYDVAERLIRERLAIAPSGYGYMLLGRVYLAQGRADAAWAALQRAARDASTPPEVVFWQARALKALNRGEEAAAAYEEYVSRGGVLAGEAYYRMARVLREMGEEKRALRAYANAVAKAPPRQKALWALEWGDYAAELGRPREAIGVYTRVLETFEVTPAQRSRAYLARGTQYHALGEMARAWADFRAAIEAAVHTGGGTRVARVEKAAIPYAYRALLILVEADRPVDDYTRGVVDVEAGAYTPAVTVLIRYLDTVSPHHGDAHAYLARALTALGNTAGAVEQWRVLIDTHPECPCWEDAWLALLRLYRRIGEERKAQILLAELLSHPRVSRELKERARLGLGEFLLRRGQLALARRVFEGLAYEATAPNIRYRAALLAAVLHVPANGERARALLQKALASSPHPQWASVLSYWLGEAAWQAGDLTEAQDVWQRLALERPRSYYAFRAAERLQEKGVSLPPWHPAPALSSHLHGDPWRSHTANVDAFLQVHPVSPAVATQLRRGAAAADAGLEARAAAAFVRALGMMEDTEGLLDLGYVLQDLGYPHLGIRAASRAVDRASYEAQALPLDYWRLLYPTPAPAYMRAVAREFAIPVPLLYAVIRQESHFTVAATSVAQAQGLMQIIPSTARLAARGLGLHVQDERDFYRPTVNVRLGAYYLATVLREFDGNVVSALAGYNGGPGNVVRWRTLYGEDDDRFIELIPVLETRVYVREVLRQRAVYERLGVGNSAPRPANPPGSAP